MSFHTCTKCGDKVKSRTISMNVHNAMCMSGPRSQMDVPLDLEDREVVDFPFDLDIDDSGESYGDDTRNESSCNELRDDVGNTAVHTAAHTAKPANDVSSYLNGLNNGRGPQDLHYINAYHEWGPKEPLDKIQEQARFLAACDAGVGISDQHAQVLLDYVKTRDGIPLPKKVKTCWKNMKRVHESMCGTLQKVIPCLICTPLSIHVHRSGVMYINVM
jgi:hypothetical protein